VCLAVFGRVDGDPQFVRGFDGDSTTIFASENSFGNSQ
jgi:hypothetical protein